MREDLLEGLEKAYPDGFICYYVDQNGCVRNSGFNMDKHKFLTSMFHLGLAIAVLSNDEVELP